MKQTIVVFLIALLLGVAGCGGGGKSAQGTDNSQTVIMPNVVGLPQATAADTLTSLGLKYTVAAGVYSNTVTVGNIAGQSPAAGSTITIDSTATLTPSMGSVPTTIQPTFTISFTPSSTVTTTQTASIRFVFATADGHPTPQGSAILTLGGKTQFTGKLDSTGAVTFKVQQSNEGTYSIQIDFTSAIGDYSNVSFLYNTSVAALHVIATPLPSAGVYRATGVLTQFRNATTCMFDDNIPYYVLVLPDYSVYATSAGKSSTGHSEALGGIGDINTYPNMVAQGQVNLPSIWSAVDGVVSSTQMRGTLYANSDGSAGNIFASAISGNCAGVFSFNQAVAPFDLSKLASVASGVNHTTNGMRMLPEPGEINSDGSFAFDTSDSKGNSCRVTGTLTPYSDNSPYYTILSHGVDHNTGGTNQYCWGTAAGYAVFTSGGTFNTADGGTSQTVTESGAFVEWGKLYSGSSAVDVPEGVETVVVKL